MSNVVHTPLPWRVADGETGIHSDDVISVACCGDAHTGGYGKGQLEHEVKAANAELIVRAVNCHDELVEALKACEAIVSEGFIPDWDWIRSVIAKATCEVGS